MSMSFSAVSLPSSASRPPSNLCFTAYQFSFGVGSSLNRRYIFSCISIFVYAALFYSLCVFMSLSVVLRETGVWFLRK